MESFHDWFLEFFQDSGDSLEDFWESTSTYLSDDFSDGPLPEDRLTKGRAKGEGCVWLCWR